jgi:hypothetical protein
MESKKNLFILILIPALFGAAVIIYFTFFHQIGTGTCQRMVPNYILWISLVVIIAITVPTSYFLISRNLEEKLKANMEIISNLVKKDEKINDDKNKEKDCKENGLFLKFLNSSERKVTEKIIENKGNILQSEISRIEGMTRLRAHRTLKELESKGIISLEKYGKTNRIILNKEIKNILFKN